jgi:hypothetical protein
MVPYNKQMHPLEGYGGKIEVSFENCISERMETLAHDVISISYFK